MPAGKTVLVGKMISRLVARAPWAWPLIRGRVGNFFNQTAPDWDKRTGAGADAHLAPLSAAVYSIKTKPESILDIGCGTGAGTFFLAREYPTSRIRGVDLSEAMIKEANHKIGLDPEARVAFRQGDASRLPWPDDHFDLVTQVNMPVFFSEINRVLRPGGYVAITSSLGMDTPFSTEHEVLDKHFRRLDINEIESGEAGAGTWFLARKEGVS